MEPIALALQAVVEAVAERALVMVDPNCRPTFIGDRDTYRRALAATLRYAHVVKVSNDDLEYLEPGAARSRRRGGCSGRPAVALVTLGGDGALIVTADAAEQVAAPKITVVDTIGAGDAFGGGFLTYWRSAASTAKRWRTPTPCGRRRASRASSPPAPASGRVLLRRGCQTSTATSEPGAGSRSRGIRSDHEAIAMPTMTAPAATWNARV